MDNTIEIIREARKAGMQTALMMFGALVIVSILFGLYIYKSFDDTPTNYITASQNNESGDNSIKQGIE